MLFKISIRIPYEIYHEILFYTKIVSLWLQMLLKKCMSSKFFWQTQLTSLLGFYYIIKRVRMYTHCPKKENSFQCQRIWTKKKISCYYENFTVIIYYKMNTQCAIWDYILFQTLWRWKEFSFVVQCGYMRDPFFILVIKIHIMCLQFFFSFQTLLSFQPK